MPSQQFYKTFFSMLLILFLTTLACEEKDTKGTGTVELKTDNDKISYSIGVNIGKTLKENNYEINPDVIAKAIKDVMGGKPLMLTEEQLDEFMKKFQTEMSAKQDATLQQEVAKNSASADSFLTVNAKKQGIVVLPDSLQYEIIKEGTGPKPKATDKVKVHYTGTLIGGTEFDSSHKSGEPIEFVVNQMIPGWSEVLPLMNVGSHWKVYIPPRLAYGDRKAGRIPPNSLLIFEIELLEIVK